MSSKTHISVRDLTVHYGSQQVLNNISLDIPDKKITAIIGPSGCGKTTLLKSFNRLIDLQDGVKVAGQVFVDGEDILDPKAEVTHLRKKMGLLSQRPQVLPMSIYDNVAYGLRIHGEKSKKKLNDVVEHYLREAAIWDEVKDRLHDSAARLSIGQQQRLCLARGLAVEPEIILGDEPTSALDPLSAERIEQRLMELKDKYTIVLVTHILRQAKRLADYVVFLYLGNLIEHGPAEQVLNKPKYLKTQNYINGQFIEDPVVDKELDLTHAASSELLSKIRSALEGLTFGQILKIVLSLESTMEDVSRSVERDGHRILEKKRINRKDWEIILQKQEGGYAI